MITESSKTRSKFDVMLDWLNSDRDDAIKKYEKIHRRLIEIMASRGCHEPEEWSDKVIDRVVAKIDEVTQGYEGDPAFYFYGVAKNVIHEYWKMIKASSEPVPPPPPPDEDREWRHTMLDDCLSQLPRDDRDLILTYYSKDGHDKIVYRTELALKLGIGLNALRIRVYRIRISLKDCIGRQLAGKS